MKAMFKQWMQLKPVRKLGWVVAGAVVVSLAAPRPAQAQFGAEIGVIIAGLTQISSILQSAVAVPLQAIQSVEAEQQQFQQLVVFPQQAIASAKAMAAGFTAPFQQMQALMQLNYSSATLPLPQQLEQQMLSADPNNIPNLTQTYSAVYGQLPAQTAAPQQILLTVDMTDAEAQDAMKKSVELDALADREMEVAQQLNRQIQSAAPGTAAILEAEGSAWVVQANAYSQSAMAELLRVESAGISNSSTDLKNSTQQTQQFDQNLTNFLQPH